MRRRDLALLLFCGAGCVACGGASSPPAVIGEAARLERCDPAEAGEVVALEECLGPDSVSAARSVAEILRTELEGGDLSGAYEEGASRVWARSPEGRPEVVLSRAQLAAVAAARREAYGEPDADSEGLTLGYRIIEARSEGDLWRLEGETVARLTMHDTERSGIRADLRRTITGWTVRALRTWPLEWSTEEEHASFDEALWARRDRWVDDARAAVEPSEPESRRRWVEALQSAHRFAEAREALEPLLSDPNRRDVAALVGLEAALGHPEASARARARLQTEDLPPGSLEARVRERCRLPLSPEEADRPAEARARLEADPDGYYEYWERCGAQVVFSAGTRSQPLGLVEVVRGAERRVSVEFVFWDGGVWSEGVPVWESVDVGDGTGGFEVSDAEELAAGELSGLRARYALERADGDVRVDEEGVLLCLRETSACRRVPDRVTRTDAEGAVVVRRYAVELVGGRLSVRRTEGPAEESEAVGEGPLRALFER